MIPGPKVQGACLAAPSSAPPADAVKTGKATIPYGQDGLPRPLHGPAEPAEGPCLPNRLAPAFSGWAPSGVRCPAQDGKTGGPRAPRQRPGATSPEQGDGSRPTTPGFHDPLTAAVGRHRQVSSQNPSLKGRGNEAVCAMG